MRAIRQAWIDFCFRRYTETVNQKRRHWWLRRGISAIRKQMGSY